VPVFDIRRRLRLEAREPRAADRLVLVRAARRLVAVPADAVDGLREVPAGSVRPPDALMRETGAIAGLVAVADGILLIQDPDAFFSPDEERRLDEALSSLAAP
jgi:purine-binding chemotaxis protein CheW